MNVGVGSNTWTTNGASMNVSQAVTVQSNVGLTLNVNRTTL